MKYATIKKTDIANGTGVRVSLFVSGCTHRCPGCFNEIAWDFEYGQEWTASAQASILAFLKPSYIQGLSLLGGEPLEPCHHADILALLKAVHDIYPEKNVWCYTGYVYEDFFPGGRAYSQNSEALLEYIDVLVDGPFLMSEKDISLQFRGSTNQRLIDVKKTQQEKQLILWNEK